MKKTITLLIVATLLFAFCFPGNTYASTFQPVTLSSLSESECIDFIISKGLHIPIELIDYPALGTFVKEVIATIENNPNHIFVINYPVTYSFANQIKEIVEQKNE